jgi:hypothetical protein
VANVLCGSATLITLYAPASLSITRIDIEQSPNAGDPILERILILEGWLDGWALIDGWMGLDRWMDRVIRNWFLNQLMVCGLFLNMLSIVEAGLVASAMS